MAVLTEAPEEADFLRTQSKILDAHASGHGVKLEAPEVERLVGMMQGMEVSVMQEAMRAGQMTRLLASVLGYLEQAAGSEALAFPGSIMNDEVTGFTAAWDEDEDVITFTLVRSTDEAEVEAEVVEA